MAQEPQPIRLEDYRPPSHLVDEIDLHFELEENVTTVRARQKIRRNPEGTGEVLELFGSALTLIALRIDGRVLTSDEYRIDGEILTIPSLPESFELEVVTHIHPASNTALEGLYLSSGNFCTQCEAEGFRKITWYPDRPDVLARFTTTLSADREKFPVLLSNGNLERQGDLPDGRHFARWRDPFPKPSYLFALVAGKLVKTEDVFVTASGRPVTLQVWTEERNCDKCDHALESLKRAMRWDEETYGLEYDLDIYMVVAVDDFNMGAMENKGLNIFNSKYVLASAQTATDTDYQAIEEVVGHEYFHNWTGNRVTCRDWFQLSLKEGLTVFRDQEFAADMTSRSVKRIDDVRLLRNSQFPEDAGPTSHPVRPASYVEINNFYTATVYNKGAEVIRMYHALLGRDGFRRGLRLYLERHDGQAVTTDDFAAAMAEAGGIDLAQFKLWYSQAGTPQLDVSRRWDPSDGTLTLTVRQSCPPTPGQERKEPFHIPFAVGLLDRSGNDLALRLTGEEAPGSETTRVLELRRDQETFVFTGLAQEPVPSLLRGFSAPVVLRSDLAEDELAFLLGHDSDPFNRWEAGQQLASKVLLRGVEDVRRGREQLPDSLLQEAFARTLDDRQADPALVAQALTLPTETYLSEQMAEADPDAVHRSREFMRASLAEALRDRFLQGYHASRVEGPYTPDPQSAGMRALKNLCLAYLNAGGSEEGAEMAWRQFQGEENMTDVLAALTCLANVESARRQQALELFYRRWESDPLVIDKWFTLQATSRLPDTLERVQALMEHPAFTLKNPNRVRSLIGAFAQGNPARFHRRDGAGYRFLSDRILELDRMNPQVAARLVTPLTRWRRYDEIRRQKMRRELERIAAVPGLSRDVYELVAKSLA
jgi:aminopeptidase N